MSRLNVQSSVVLMQDQFCAELIESYKTAVVVTWWFCSFGGSLLRVFANACLFLVGLTFGILCQLIREIYLCGNQ